MSRRGVVICNIWDHQIEEFILWASTASWMSVPIDKNHGYEVLRLYKIGTNTTVVFYQRHDGSVTSAHIGRKLVDQFVDEKRVVSQP